MSLQPIGSHSIACRLVYSNSCRQQGTSGTRHCTDGHEIPWSFRTYFSHGVSLVAQPPRTSRVGSGYENMVGKLVLKCSPTSQPHAKAHFFQQPNIQIKLGQLVFVDQSFGDGSVLEDVHVHSHFYPSRVVDR